MTIQARIRTAAVVCAAAAAMFVGGAILPTVTPVASAGPCLFGHVDPKNDNSACRGSDAANWPESEKTADGSPSLTCSRLNDGARVRTDEGFYGWRFWICKKYKDSWGHTYYQWTEVLGQ